MARRLAAGNEEAFREFHRDYFDRLYRFLLAVTGGREQEAREALQETLLRVARVPPEIDSEESFWHWVKAVARNAARDGGRKRSRYMALLERFTHGAPAALAPAPEVEEPMRAMLEETLAELAPMERQLVEGKYLDGATVEALALQTRLTQKAVESRLLRARQFLRARLLEKLRTQDG